ncbi:MAG: hypothetical protein ACI9JY_002959, partial [Saprospiraceae bacterium]
SQTALIKSSLPPEEKMPPRTFVLNLFNQKNDTRLVYHNYAFGEKLVAAARNIAENNSFSQQIVALSRISAWLYGTGFLYDYQKPSLKSLEIGERFMQINEVPPAAQSEIFEAIKAAFERRFSNSKVAQVLNDALLSISYGDDFFEDNPLLRLEKELMTGQKFSKADWTQFQLQELLKVQYLTPCAKVDFEPILAKNILVQKTLVEKSIGDIVMVNSDAPLRKFQNLEKKLPSSATQTFFRTNYRNHINLSSIADGKANIMISVNAILISVIISVVSYRNLTETQPEVLMPAVIFLVTGMTSLVFAVLSARPKVTNVNKDHLNADVSKQNLVFFGNFVHLELEEYEEAMDAMFRDSELIYGNMTRDLYFLGKVLDKKYQFLTISYNVFMVGFVATVLTFLVALFV